MFIEERYTYLNCMALSHLENYVMLIKKEETMICRRRAAYFVNQSK